MKVKKLWMVGREFGARVTVLFSSRREAEVVARQYAGKPLLVPVEVRVPARTATSK